MPKLQAKNYKLSAALIGLLLLTALFLLAVGRPPRVPKEPNVATVLIREGLTVAQVSELLNKAGVLAGESLSTDLEGYLFPDTYEFYTPSTAGAVVQRFSENFNKKVFPAVAKALAGKPNIPPDLDRIITVASMVEREVPGTADRRLVSGIIWKRLKNDFSLQVDSTLCYALPEPCHPLSRADLELDTPYNTYTRKGLPPTPIANPGLDAILAAVGPTSSPYWFYLSDPVTKKTIFSVNLDEHRGNVVKYLR